MVNNLGDKLLPVKPWCPKVEIRSETSSDTHALMSLAEGTINHQIVVISYTLLQFCFAFHLAIYVILNALSPCNMSIFIIMIHFYHFLKFTTSHLSIMAGEKNILVKTSIQMYTRMHVTIFTVFKISPPFIIVGGRCMQVTIFTIFSIF